MNKILDINERILYLIENQYNDNQKKFAESIGYSAQVVFNIVSGRKTKPSYDVLNAIISTNDDINSQWLLTGQGSMLKSENEKNSEVPATRDKKLIPFYDGVVTAGMSETAMLDASQQPAEMIDAGDWFRDATAAMRVHGDSMYPEYKSGSIAALREVHNKRLVVYGQDYLIETSEYRVIKRLQKSDVPQSWLACSVNEEKYESSGRLIHEPFDVHIDDVIRLYQVLGNVKRNQSSTVIHTNTYRNN